MSHRATVRVTPPRSPRTERDGTRRGRGATIAENARLWLPAELLPHRLLEDYSPFVIPNEQHHVMEGHLGNVKCVEFLGDQGNRLVSGSRSVR